MECLCSLCTALGIDVITNIFYAVCRAVYNTSNVENLRAKMQELETKRGELQSRVDDAKKDGDIIKEDVMKYISEAAHLFQKANTFITDEWERAVIKCFCWVIPNLVLRRRLSISAKEMANELACLIQDAAGDRFRTISSRPALQNAIADRTGYEDFGSRTKILKEIMDALSCDEVSRVGVWGMGGVGKTMLAHEVARQATKSNLFSEVAFIPISQTQNLKNIQDVVADKINLVFKGITTLEQKAHLLKCRLKEEKRFLIILDDIWDRLDLVQVGLNFDNDQKGCKILMTSRALNVTSGSMGAQKNIKVEHLSDIDARNLFNTIVGTNIVIEQQLVDNVVKECEGLPLVIRVVASALKDKKSPRIWEDALRQLQNAAPKNIDKMLTEVYPSIKLSFDSLESEEAQKLLLLCSLYGEDVNIQVEEIMMLSIGLDYLSDVHTVEAARNRVESLVDTLKDRCLLLDGYRCDHVKMHDVIRDVAIHISENSWDMHRYMINDSLENYLSDKKLEGAKALSLLRNPDSIELPKIKLQCPQLELFLISFYYSYGHTPNIMNLILNESRNLKVWSLHRVDLLLLPSSLHFLHNLKILRLHNCKLDDIDFIGDQQNLRVLDLKKSTIQQLPSKIGKLTRLQVLNMEECQQLEVISENVISSLTKLEELYLPSNFNYWKTEEVSTDRRNSNLAELMNLKKLTTLFLSIPDAKFSPKGFIFSQNLQRYRIGIGSNYDDQREVTKSLVLRDCEESRLKEHGIEALMRMSESLGLGGFVGGVKNNVVYDLDKEGFPELKSLELNDCSEVQYVVNMLESPVFLKLESLHLENLENLEEICHGMLILDSFSQLRNVTVKNCGKLKNLFRSSIATSLHQIEVKECEMMEGIVGHHQLGATTTSSSAKSFNYPLFGEKVQLSSSIL